MRRLIAGAPSRREPDRGRCAARACRRAGRRRGRRSSAASGSCVTSSIADAALAADLARAARASRRLRRAVEVAGRLVGEDQARVVRERAGDRDALALAHRQPLRRVLDAVGEPEPREPRRRLLARRAGAEAVGEQLQRGVVDRRDGRHQVEGLEHEPERSGGSGRSRRARGSRRCARRTARRRDPGASSPAASSSNVVLPDPLGPYSATISPGATVSETPSAARTTSLAAAVVLDDPLQLEPVHVTGSGCAGRTCGERDHRGRLFERAQLPAADRHHALGAAEAGDVARDDDRGELLALGDERAQQAQDRLALVGVGGCSGLVDEQQPRRAHERPRERDACELARRRARAPAPRRSRRRRRARSPRAPSPSPWAVGGLRPAAGARRGRPWACRSRHAALFGA